MTGLVLALAAFLLAACSGKAAEHQAAANFHMKRGDLTNALAELRTAHKLVPKNPRVLTRLGDALFEAQRYEEAEKNYRAAVELDPTALSARRGLAQVAIRRGHVAEAETILRDLAAQAPAEVDLQLALGTLLAARGDPTTARAAFEAAQRLAPRHPAVLYNLGRAQLRVGDVPGAQETFEELQDLTPEKPYAAYGRALVYASRGNTPGACAALKEALAKGLADRRSIERDAELGSLRDAPCFVATLTEVGQ